MKKLNRFLSVLLGLLMMLTVLPLSLLRADAQECVWCYQIGDKMLDASEIKGGAVAGLSMEGSYLVLNNYSGTYIGAIATGNYGDDDAPVLRIKLIGENTLSGGFLKDRDGDDLFNGNYAALYAEPRGGGYGDNSKITIGGSGTLNINCTVRESAKCVYGIYCGDSLSVVGGTVNLDVSGGGITGKELVGVYADTTVSGSGILHVEADAYTYRKIISKTPLKRILIQSSCNVYGINGDVEVKADRGYVSVDTSDTYTSGEAYCVNGKALFEDSTDYFRSALYLISGNDNLAHDGVSTDDNGWSDRTNYSKRAFKNTNDGTTTLNYLAVGPVNDDIQAQNGSLCSLNVYDLASVFKFPAAGEDKIFETSFTAHDNLHFYAKQQTFLCDYETGQAYLNSIWDMHTYNEDSDYYDFTLYFHAMPGYWSNVNAGNYTMSRMLGAFEYEPDAEISYIRDTYMSAGYQYAPILISEQPKAVNAKSSDISVTAVSDENDLTYEWFLEVFYGAEDTPAVTIPMSEFDEMGYGFTGQNTASMYMGDLDENETVKDCDFTYGDASSFRLYCKINTIGSSKITDKVEYTPFGVAHNFTGPVKSNGDGTHSFKCTDCDLYGNTEDCTPVIKNAKAATETEGGYTGDKVCSVCGYLFEKGKDTPNLTEDITYGDVNGDGEVTAADARLALRASVKLETLDTKQTEAADVDGVVGISAADARLILRYSVKLESFLPAN